MCGCGCLGGGEGSVEGVRLLEEGRHVKVNGREVENRDAASAGDVARGTGGSWLEDGDQMK